MFNNSQRCFISLIVGLSFVLLGGCTPKVATSTKEAVMVEKPISPEAARLAHAKELAQKFVIADGHVDLPYRLRVQNFQLTKEFLEIPIKSEKGDFDYERSKTGGLDAPFMSIYLPARYQESPGRSKAVSYTHLTLPTIRLV